MPSYNDGGFIYRPWGWSLAGGTLSYGSMTGAGIWGLLLSGVPKTDERVTAAINWVTNHYTWDNNPVYGWRPYYYYLSMSKALTMYGQTMIDASKQELRIEIFATADPDNVLQESYYGDTSRDYRISSVLYVTNFKTIKGTPMEYTVAIYRDTFDVGRFTFETVK